MNFPLIEVIKSARLENLSVACKIADSVICLPIHHELGVEEIDRILKFDCIVMNNIGRRKKKLLLLGGLRYLLPVIKVAHNLGYYVITCDYLQVISLINMQMSITMWYY